MNLKEIQNLIKFVAKSGASEVKLEIEDVKITIRTGGSNKTQFQQMTLPVSVPQAPLPQAATLAETTVDAESVAEVPTSDDSKYITIKSPIIGTFYRRPSPDKPIFAEVGQTIAEGDVLCIIEAMKLFNEIESEVSGKIIKILVDDSSPVEFDQPLFLVDPS
ncbi:MAG: acetyl-CoA carboxylase, biotin carboxyl carrier protein [Formosa sp.]|nr:acetyl-CoA carboxylase, biotin carboxyl carrier protein [Formosa sp.]|tara:strand:- start:2837 stop:3322 length:486 start_codon:yes stop_codon:yes gene_type:complete